MKNSFVVVTTDNEKRGVFGGILIEHDKDAKTVVLKNAQMAVHWSAETKGVVGLASRGAARGSKITPPCDEMFIDGVTAVMKATDEAKNSWESQPWD